MNIPRLQRYISERNKNIGSWKLLLISFFLWSAPQSLASQPEVVLDETSGAFTLDNPCEQTNTLAQVSINCCFLLETPYVVRNETVIISQWRIFMTSTDCLRIYIDILVQTKLSMCSDIFFIYHFGISGLRWVDIYFLFQPPKENRLTMQRKHYI